jgi:predicted glycogen debranching enzyme
MTPSPGERLQRFVGDHVSFVLKAAAGQSPAAGWQARLRSNLGRAEALRREIIQAHTQGVPPTGASWRDLPMTMESGAWMLQLPLSEVGYFRAKAYLVDPAGWQHWPAGPDVSISIHPDSCRTGNLIYCAFPRLFGRNKGGDTARGESQEELLTSLEQRGYTVIPPSGKLRDLTDQLPHILGTLHCRILHLLPVNPTPTTGARFGRFGSPYAALDLTAIDPSLVVFDKRTTGVDQFRELTYAAHLRGARVILDIVINHTGWGSALQETHPEWFLRQANGTFVSPGAWGVTWEDLVELKHQHVQLWDELSEAFLTWCRRGVDGFRCDAGYKVPARAWQYIVARVQQEFPETIFLLEGLGGAWEATETLLAEGGMQWAYSELFQNYSGPDIARYLDHSFKQNERVGLLVHYSETHDNDRLAARGSAWSLLRNRLCALTSASGGFGFTCGVEWLSSEKISVHQNSGLGWGGNENLVAELANLNRLLAEHPCFFDGARLTRLSPLDSPVYALRRESAEGADVILVLVNADINHAQKFELDQAPGSAELSQWIDLLGQELPEIAKEAGAKSVFILPPGSAYCLSPARSPRGLSGEGYRRARAQAAWASTALACLLPARAVPVYPWRALAEMVDENPEQFLAAISSLSLHLADTGGAQAFKANYQSPGTISEAMRQATFPRVVRWRPPDRARITLVPPGHWLLICDDVPFRATLTFDDDTFAQHVPSIALREGHIACFAPRQEAAETRLSVERYTEDDSRVEAMVRFLAPQSTHAPVRPHRWSGLPKPTNLALLTNDRGGMARLCVDLGRVLSKYDCVLGANLHPRVPVDRHIFAKRIRVWVNADGFISPLDFRSLDAFEPGQPALWKFVADAGDGRKVEIQLRAWMNPGRNSTLFQFCRAAQEPDLKKQTDAFADVRLTVRLDIEDRNFHWETKRNGGAEHHFSTNLHTLGTAQDEDGAPSKRRRDKPAEPRAKIGFAFTPAQDRQLRVFSDKGNYHPDPEWSENIPHPVEQSRGHVSSGDAFSPGWFELPMERGIQVTLVVTAETEGWETEAMYNNQGRASVRDKSSSSVATRGLPADNSLGERLLRATRSFVVQRDAGKTIIAGYPWFLDWGRDTFICARGVLAAGLTEEVKQLVLTFARFEKNGTLPNTIYGDDASNRDTSDAPLWFALVCEELAQELGPLSRMGAVSGRSLPEVLESIAENYIKGTPNGIRMDPASGLIWSPSHFTWMDTNYPACTPREGYPVEIQALWLRLLRHLQRLAGRNGGQRWADLAERALASLNKLFWREERGYYADVLRAGPRQPASDATVDDALRSNCMLVPSLGQAEGDKARGCVEATRRHLVVPGALRSLAPLPVFLPLPIYTNDGRLLNNPKEPYWGRYEGDEDTRRKPAYHNGTAWTWTFPVFCEALARAWDFSPEAVATAKAYLGSIDHLLDEGCLGQLPEIIDGDTPHTQRGCDAQAWGATEALRVWKLLVKAETESRQERG